MHASNGKESGAGLVKMCHGRHVSVFRELLEFAGGQLALYMRRKGSTLDGHVRMTRFCCAGSVVSGRPSHCRCEYWECRRA